MDKLEATSEIEAQREELVAYLDGELDEASRRRVEERLATDSAYRTELQLLEQAWDCLDQLPMQTVDEQFTRSTIEMVALAAEEDVVREQAELPKRRRLRTLVVLGTFAGSLFAGYLLAAAVWPNANRALVEQFPLV